MTTALLLFLASLGLAPGDHPPPIDAPDLQGNKVSLQELRGRVVLVDFWATWCVPCRRALPIYAEMYRRLKEKGFEVVAVSVDEERGNVDDYVATNKLPFRVVHDADGVIVERFAPPKMPTCYLIDSAGKLAKVFPGFNDATHKSLDAAVQALLKAAAPTPAPKKEAPPTEKGKPDPKR